MEQDLKLYVVQTVGVFVRAVMLFFVLKFTATEFDGTEMIALLAFLGGDSVISIVKTAIRAAKKKVTT